MRLLCVYPGLVPPPKNPQTDQAFYFPAPLSGDILLPTWAERPEEILDALGPGSYPEHRVGNFTYHLFLAGTPRQSIGAKTAILRFFLREGLRLSKKQKFDCILCYGWMSTGIASVILARLTRTKLIVTVPGVPENAYRFNSYSNPYDDSRQSLSKPADLRTRLARRLSDFLLQLVVGRADCARLLYPDQLRAYPKLAKVSAYITHDFVPMSQIPESEGEDGSVLLVGAPWFVKGVDILIRAFRTVEAEFPNTKLRLLGHYPNEDFKDLIGDSRQIEVLKARNHPETMKVMANCSIYALASRTEAAPRVVLEAMAAGKPVIASRVGGVSHYVRDGVTGLLFEPEDVNGLARHMHTLLSSVELRSRFGEAGRALARTEYDEASLGRKICDMVERTVTGQPQTSDARAVNATGATQ